MNQTSIELFNNIPDSVFQKIIQLFHRSTRPLFLGQISLEIGWSLERTEKMIQLLISQHVIRCADVSELKFVDAHPESNVFVLLSERSIARAHKW